MEGVLTPLVTPTPAVAHKAPNTSTGICKQTNMTIVTVFSSFLLTYEQQENGKTETHHNKSVRVCKYRKFVSWYILSIANGRGKVKVGISWPKLLFANSKPGVWSWLPRFWLDPVPVWWLDWQFFYFYRTCEKWLMRNKKESLAKRKDLDIWSPPFINIIHNTQTVSLTICNFCSAPEIYCVG